MQSREKQIDLSVVLEEIAAGWMLDAIEAAGLQFLRVTLLVTHYRRGIAGDAPEWDQLPLRDYGDDVCGMIAELCGPLTKQRDQAIYRAVNRHVHEIELVEADFLPDQYRD